MSILKILQQFKHKIRTDKGLGRVTEGHHNYSKLQNAYLNVRGGGGGQSTQTNINKIACLLPMFVLVYNTIGKFIFG